MGWHSSGHVCPYRKAPWTEHHEVTESGFGPHDLSGDKNERIPHTRKIPRDEFKLEAESLGKLERITRAAVKSVLQSVDSKMIPKSDSLPKTPDIGVFFCHLPVLAQHCIDTCVQSKDVRHPAAVTHNVGES